jgi:hypothetical protein
VVLLLLGELLKLELQPVGPAAPLGLRQSSIRFTSAGWARKANHCGLGLFSSDTNQFLSHCEGLKAYNGEVPNAYP